MDLYRAELHAIGPIIDIIAGIVTLAVALLFAGGVVSELRHRHRYRVRTLLLVVTAVALLLGLASQKLFR